MTKSEVNQLVVNSFISSFYVSFKHRDTWAKPEDVYVHPDHSLGRRRRVGIYGWVLANDGKEYGSGFDFPLSSFHLNYSSDEEEALAVEAAHALSLMLDGRLDPPYPTREAMDEALRPFEDIL